MSKKGIASLSTYSLLILMLIVLVFFSYGYYSTNKAQIELDVLEKENLNSLLQFRLSLVSFSLYDNSTLNYTNLYDPQTIIIYTNSTDLIAIQDINNDRVSYSIKSLTPPFCSSSSFSPYQGVILEYNGSCISVIT